jgi:hypothetical protein
MFDIADIYGDRRGVRTFWTPLIFQVIFVCYYSIFHLLFAYLKNQKSYGESSGD